MSQNYFTMFPNFTYNGSAAINILARVVMRRHFRENFSLYFKYHIKDNERADQIANDYYGNSFYDWLIYLINDIIDPFYDWPLNNDNFNSMIVDRFGSVAKAQQIIRYWASNWFNDPTQLSISAFNALTANQVQYWEPIIITGNIITGYQRKQKDIIVTTNQITQLTFANTANVVDGDILEQTANNQAQGTVSFVSNNIVNIQHVFGTWSNNTSYTIQDLSSNVVVGNAVVNTLAINISSDVLSLFSPISAYDDEQNQNDSKRFIHLLNRDSLPAAEALVQSVLKGQALL